MKRIEIIIRDSIQYAVDNYRMSSNEPNTLVNYEEIVIRAVGEGIRRYHDEFLEHLSEIMKELEIKIN